MSTSEATDKRRSLVAPGKSVKLVVWDLDNTIWNGVLLEDKVLALRSGILELVEGFDRFGVLQSIASRNDPAPAKLYLQRLGIEDYFLAPQISWSNKSASIGAIAKALNVGLDTVLFIDDQPFELEEVAHVHPQVRTLNAAELDGLLDDPHIQPSVVTQDARRRRAMYLEDEARRRSEDEFTGPSDEFMLTLGMELGIALASRDDLDRAEELTLRTNQLNSTGSSFSRVELDSFIESERHELIIVSLKDRFGDYGKIGLALIESITAGWNLKLLLVSCRVLSRGIGTIVLNYLTARANIEGVRLQVEFCETGRNRAMKLALMMAGFQNSGSQDGTFFFVRQAIPIPPCPSHIKLVSTW